MSSVHKKSSLRVPSLCNNSIIISLSHFFPAFRERQNLNNSANVSAVLAISTALPCRGAQISAEKNLIVLLFHLWKELLVIYSHKILELGVIVT